MSKVFHFVVGVAVHGQRNRDDASDYLDEALATDGLIVNRDPIVGPMMNDPHVVGYTVTNPKGTTFLMQGTHNSEHDGDETSVAPTDATVFESVEAAVSGLLPPYTKAHYGDADLARFLRTAIVREVRVSATGNTWRLDGTPLVTRDEPETEEPLVVIKYPQQMYLKSGTRVGVTYTADGEWANIGELVDIGRNVFVRRATTEEITALYNRFRKFFTCELSELQWGAS